MNNTLVSGQKIPFFADPDQPFNRRILGGIHKADDTVERTGIGEYVLEVEVVTVSYTHLRSMGNWPKFCAS